MNAKLDANIRAIDKFIAEHTERTDRQQTPPVETKAPEQPRNA